MKKHKVIIATRASKLALWQADFVGKELQGLGLEYELLPMTTTGDEIQDQSLSKIGGKGLFVKEVERALLQGKADLAVHSLKDMPVKTPEHLEIVATPKRHDRGDVMIFSERLASVLQDFAEILRDAQNDNRHAEPIMMFSERMTSEAQDSAKILRDAQNDNRHPEPKAKDLSTLHIGTSSLRRRYLLKHLLKMQKTSDLRGNVITRLEKLDSGQYDAIILAEASLNRLNIQRKNVLPLPLETFIPCAGQGSLAIEMPADHPLKEVVRKLNHADTHFEVSTERMLLAALGGDCTMPCGIHAEKKGSDLYLRAVVLDQHGDKAHTSLTCNLLQMSQSEIMALAINELKKTGLEKIFFNLGLNLPSFT